MAHKLAQALDPIRLPACQVLGDVEQMFWRFDFSGDGEALPKIPWSPNTSK